MDYQCQCEYCVHLISYGNMPTDPTPHCSFTWDGDEWFCNGCDPDGNCISKPCPKYKPYKGGTTYDYQTNMGR